MIGHPLTRFSSFALRRFAIFFTFVLEWSCRATLHFVTFFVVANKYSEALDSVENDILSSFATIIAKIKSTSNFDAMTHLLWAVFNVIFERNGRMKKFFESGGHMAVADLLKGLNNHEILENYAVYQIVFNLVTQLSTSGAEKPHI